LGTNYKGKNEDGKLETLSSHTFLFHLKYFRIFKYQVFSEDTPDHKCYLGVVSHQEVEILCQYYICLFHETGRFMEQTRSWNIPVTLNRIITLIHPRFEKL
jgi:hypothetical protein